MAAADVLNKLFAKMDADNSGSINEAELSQAFKDFDRDASGTVSQDEWVQHFTSKFGASQAQALNTFKHLDSAGKGEISLDELGKLFKRMDSDGNGSVSRDEFFGFWTKLLEA